MVDLQMVDEEVERARIKDLNRTLEKRIVFRWRYRSFDIKTKEKMEKP